MLQGFELFKPHLQQYEKNCRGIATAYILYWFHLRSSRNYIHVFFYESVSILLQKKYINEALMGGEVNLVLFWSRKLPPFSYCAWQII